MIILYDSITESEMFAAFDLDGNGEAEIADAVLMQSYILGRIKAFPAGIYKNI